MNSSLNKLTKRQKENRKRILEISFERNLSHIGSCLNAVDIIDAIYSIKKKKDEFILSSGHASIAWYVVLERHKKIDPKRTMKLNIHPDRNEKNGIKVSSGSLGHGLPIALGMAIADKKSNVFCLISDGECSEGSIWESLSLVKKMNIHNLKILVTVNGWGAYDPIDQKSLKKKIIGFGCKVVEVDGHNSNELEKKLSKEILKPTVFFIKTKSSQFPFLKGQDAHYYVMSQSDYSRAIKTLS